MWANFFNRLKTLFSSPPTPVAPEPLGKPADVSAVAARMGAGQQALTTLRCVTARDKEGRVSYEIAPRELYPVALASLVHALDTGTDPGGALSNYYRAAARLPAEAWEWALMAWPQFSEQFDPNGPERAHRRMALELAQRWFIEHLHQETGGDGAAMKTRVLKDPDWKG